MTRTISQSTSYEIICNMKGATFEEVAGGWLVNGIRVWFNKDTGYFTTFTGIATKGFSEMVDAIKKQQQDIMPVWLRETMF